MRWNLEMVIEAGRMSQQMLAKLKEPLEIKFSLNYLEARLGFYCLREKRIVKCLETCRMESNSEIAEIRDIKA